LRTAGSLLSIGNGRLKLLAQDRWSASLPDEFRDVLSQRQPLFRVSGELVQIDCIVPANAGDLLTTVSRMTILYHSTPD
jgi:hypothetical protein